jgi:hypothetical protein
LDIYVFDQRIGKNGIEQHGALCIIDIALSKGYVEISNMMFSNWAQYNNFQRNECFQYLYKSY